MYCTGISGGGVHVTDAVQHATFLLDERNCRELHNRPCCLGTSVFASTVGYNVVGAAAPCFRYEQTQSVISSIITGVLVFMWCVFICLVLDWLQVRPPVSIRRADDRRPPRTTCRNSNSRRRAFQIALLNSLRVSERIMMELC